MVFCFYLMDGLLFGAHIQALLFIFYLFSFETDTGPWGIPTYIVETEVDMIPVAFLSDALLHMALRGSHGIKGLGNRKMTF